MPDWSEAIRRAVEKALSAAVSPPTSREVRAAAVLVEELRPIALEQRVLRIRNQRPYQSVLVAERILKVAADDAFEDPALALEWLDTLNSVLESNLEAPPDGRLVQLVDLVTRSFALRALTLTRMDRLEAARDVVAIARTFDPIDPVAMGELDEAEGAIAAWSQKLPEALQYFQRARNLYELIGDSHLVARAELRMCHAYGEAGDYPTAVDYALRACEGLNASRDRRLMFVAMFNLARYLRDAGRLEGALSVIGRVRAVFEQLGRRTDRLHLVWFEASVQAELGEFDQAAQLYEAAIEGFGDLELLSEVAGIALEVAESFDRAGRGHLAIPLLTAAVTTMRSLGRERDELAAWIALRDATARRMLTAAVLEAARAARQQL